MSNTDVQTLRKKMEDRGVLWRMNYENMSGAHAEFTSGKHADGYCNCAKIVVDPQFVSEIAAAMIEKITPEFGGSSPTFVVGPAYGAITFAHEVARQLGAQFGFTEVEYNDEGKMQVLKRFDIPKDASVLVIEDVVTTGGSALKTVNVLEAQGLNVLPVIGLIMNWSGEEMLDGKKIVALFNDELNLWEPEDCELCKKGGEAVRPKSHWDELSR